MCPTLSSLERSTSEWPRNIIDRKRKKKNHNKRNETIDCQIGKESFNNDLKLKEENKRKDLEIKLTKELCMMKRKHFNIFHK